MVFKPWQHDITPSPIGFSNAHCQKGKREGCEKEAFLIDFYDYGLRDPPLLQNLSFLQPSLRVKFSGKRRREKLCFEVNM